jgi:protein arginine kinase
MVNEEDHLRIQLIRSGLALSEAWEQIDRFDDQLESRVGYAFHPRKGYLTACPTNVGTGVRVSVMLHLPGLKLTGEIDKARRAAKAMSLAVRGFYGEGSEAAGDLYQISNQTTLGKSEQQILEEFERSIIPDIIRFERQARETLLDRRRPMLEDRVHRALGTLRYARLLNADEAMQLLSQLRLGILMGVVEDVDLRTVAELQLLTQPAHLQRAIGETLDQAQRRRARAKLVRERLGA